MKFIMYIYFKTANMRTNWKKIALYILRIVELVITGAAVFPSTTTLSSTTPSPKSAVASHTQL